MSISRGGGGWIVYGRPDLLSIKLQGFSKYNEGNIEMYPNLPKPTRAAISNDYQVSFLFLDFGN